METKQQNFESFDENQSLQVIKEMIQVSLKKLKNDAYLEQQTKLYLEHKAWNTCRLQSKRGKQKRVKKQIPRSFFNN